jgi:hypothetical protein
MGTFTVNVIVMNERPVVNKPNVFACYLKKCWETRLKKKSLDWNTLPSWLENNGSPQSLYQKVMLRGVT